MTIWGVSIVDPGKEQVVQCVAQCLGLTGVQLYLPLYGKNGLIRSNGVVQVEPSHKFLSQIEKFVKYRAGIQKGQVVAALLIDRRAVLESNTNISEVLRV